MTSLYHWSAKPFTLQQRSYTQEIAYKPHGLWFDVDADWKRWCDSENFRPEELMTCHEVKLLGGNVLELARALDLDDFTERFGAWPERYPDSLRTGVHHINIDWPKVAEMYDGIIIAPYCWERRMELMWYYGFDCASGCVWNTDIVAMTLLREIPQLVAE